MEATRASAVHQLSKAARQLDGFECPDLLVENLVATFRIQLGLLIEHLHTKQRKNLTQAEFDDAVRDIEGLEECFVAIQSALEEKNK